MTSASSIEKELDRLFRNSYGKIVSILLSKFGVQHLEQVENGVMEAYYKALKTWPLHHIPDDPSAWLYRTAKNAILDSFRKESRRLEWMLNYKEEEDHTEVNLDDSIRDPELKLLFLICHPALEIEDRLTFMLKTLSGLGNSEIANALMKKESAIKKRLQRVRKKIKKENVLFDWPEPSELLNRLSLVHKSLYLLFNEGYYSSNPELWMRKDLCLEAMRLCKYLTEHPIANTDTLGLMALMCYHVSRYESRIDQNGHAILLDQQDRSKWNDYFIQLGHYHLEKSASLSDQKTKYQLEAFISCQHCMAKSIEDTDWKLLKTLYQKLHQLEPSDLILLNLIIVHLHLDDVDNAKALFESLKSENFSNKTFYYMVGVKVYEKLKDAFQIELMLERAIHSSSNQKENSVFIEKLNRLRN